MLIARQFVLVMASLGCTAALSAFAGSAVANWITVVDHPLVMIEGPAYETPEAPAPLEQRQLSQGESSVPDREPVVDLYGNEVTAAVAKYLLDSRGAVYEEHSPQTEVPRLASPKS